MIDFKKSIFYGFNNIKWYYLFFIFLLILAYAITSALADPLKFPTLSVIILLLFFPLVFGGIIGTKISGKIKNGEELLILKNTGVYALMSLIYAIAEITVAIIGMIVISLITTASVGSLTGLNDIESLIYGLPSGTLVGIILLFLIFGFFIMILEFMKIIGLVKSFKTNKLRHNFNISKNFKAVFTKDYFTIILFCLGYMMFGVILIIICSITLYLFGEIIPAIITNILSMILLYITTSANYSLIADYQTDKK